MSAARLPRKCQTTNRTHCEFLPCHLWITEKMLSGFWNATHVANTHGFCDHMEASKLSETKKSVDEFREKAGALDKREPNVFLPQRLIAVFPVCVSPDSWLQAVAASSEQSRCQERSRQLCTPMPLDQGVCSLWLISPSPVSPCGFAYNSTYFSNL